MIVWPGKREYGGTMAQRCKCIQTYVYAYRRLHVCMRQYYAGCDVVVKAVGLDKTVTFH